MSDVDLVGTVVVLRGAIRKVTKVTEDGKVYLVKVVDGKVQRGRPIVATVNDVALMVTAATSTVEVVPSVEPVVEPVEVTLEVTPTVE